MSLWRLALVKKGADKAFSRDAVRRWLLQVGVHPWLERLKVKPGVRRKFFFLFFVSPISLPVPGVRF